MLARHDRVPSTLSYLWNWGQGPELLREKLATVVARLKGARDMKAHLRGVGQRLPGGRLREKIFAGMFALMLADGRFDREEKTAALAFAADFEIAPARAMELVQQVTAARVAAARGGSAGDAAPRGGRGRSLGRRRDVHEALSRQRLRRHRRRLGGIIEVATTSL